MAPEQPISASKRQPCCQRPASIINSCGWPDDHNVPLQLAHKIGLPWLLRGFDIKVHLVKLLYVPKQLAPTAARPGMDAGFSLQCLFDIPAIKASRLDMTLVVTSTVKSLKACSSPAAPSQEIYMGARHSQDHDGVFNLPIISLVS